MTSDDWNKRVFSGISYDLLGNHGLILEEVTPHQYIYHDACMSQYRLDSALVRLDFIDDTKANDLFERMMNEQSTSGRRTHRNDALTESIEECDWYISTFSDNYNMSPELKLTLIRAILQRKNELQAIDGEEWGDG